MFVIWAVGKDFFGHEVARMGVCDLKTKKGAERRAKELASSVREFGAMAVPNISALTDAYDEIGRKMVSITNATPTILLD